MQNLKLISKLFDLPQEQSWLIDGQLDGELLLCSQLIAGQSDMPSDMGSEGMTRLGRKKTYNRAECNKIFSKGGTSCLWQT